MKTNQGYVIFSATSWIRMKLEKKNGSNHLSILGHDSKKIVVKKAIRLGFWRKFVGVNFVAYIELFFVICKYVIPKWHCIGITDMVITFQKGVSEDGLNK